MFEQFDEFVVSLGEVEIAGRVSRASDAQRPPLLLLHGHPETHMIWHRIADRLAEHYTVVVPDLRGYGRSSKPQSDPLHLAYSKRTMARDQVLLMEHFGNQLGFEKFAVCAHDRGARVAHRLLVDYPELVTQAMLLDIAPTLDMYESTSRAFAEAYFHWFFLIQPEPLPETLINGNPRAYVENLMGSRYAGLGPFPPEILDHYVTSLSEPGAAHAMCEDYRASSTIDLDHDRDDRKRNRIIDIPIRVLWGSHGVIERLFDPLALWGALASRVTGRSVNAGHYLPEEVPDEIFEEILSFIPTTNSLRTE